MLLYSLLHLTGYDVSLDDLKSFRQWGSKTPGPPGVRPRAGRRGDDRAARPGLRERRRHGDRRAPPRRRVQSAGSRRRRPLDVHALLRRRPPGGHRVGGGVARRPSPARGSWSRSTTTTTSSSTGRHRWPGRRTSSPGSTPTAGTRPRVEDGNDIEAIAAAIEEARADDRPEPDRRPDPHRLRQPEPPGHAEGARPAAGRGRGPARQGGLRLGSGPGRSTCRPRRCGCSAGGPGRRGPRRGVGATRSMPTPTTTRTSRRRSGGASSSGRLADGWDAGLPTYPEGEEVATRNASQDVDPGAREPLPRAVRWRRGPVGVEPDRRQGRARVSRPTSPAATSASASASTRWAGSPTGIAYHGGFIPYVGTFLTFSDYMRGSVRLAALSGLHVIYVWTHDSVGLGEDGPTHQPVEHYAALRAIPNLWFVRPGDANETAAAWAVALERGLGDPVRAGRAVADAAEAADAARARRRSARDGSRPRRLRPARGERRCAADHPDRDRVGAAAGVPRGGGAGGGRRPGARRLAPLLGAVRAPGRRPTATRCCRVTCGPGSPSRRACRSAGSAGSATRARSSGSTTSVRRAPAGTIFERFGFTVDRVVGVARDVLDGKVRGPRPDARAGSPACAARRPPEPRPRRPGRRPGNGASDPGHS